MCGSVCALMSNQKGAFINKQNKRTLLIRWHCRAQVVARSRHLRPLSVRSLGVRGLVTVVMIVIIGRAHNTVV
jgi:hypothetical protein